MQPLPPRGTAGLTGPLGLLAACVSGVARSVRLRVWLLPVPGVVRVVSASIRPVAWSVFLLPVGTDSTVRHVQHFPTSLVGGIWVVSGLGMLTQAVVLRTLQRVSLGAQVCAFLWGPYWAAGPRGHQFFKGVFPADTSTSSV